MPFFTPPLAQSFTFPIAPTSLTSYAHLSFFATFALDEDRSGSLEIWTDLPSLDEQGELKTAEGEWRAITFSIVEEKVRHNQSVVNAYSNDAIPTIRLNSTPSPVTNAESTTTTLYRSVVIPAVSQTYAYTFRHVLPSGETHWLGGEGTNGVIRLEEGSSEDSKDESLPGGARWEGFAIELNRENDSTPPNPLVHLLPTNKSISPSIVALSTRLSFLDHPFCRISPSPSTEIPTRSTVHVVCLSESSSSLRVLSGSAVPEKSVRTFMFQQKDSKLQDILAKALTSSSLGVDLAVGHLMSSADVTALVYTPTGIANSQTAYVAIYVPAAKCSQYANLTLPPAPTSAPRKITTLSQSTFIPNLSRKLRIEFAAGQTAQVLSLHEFTEIRGIGADDAIHMWAPDATVLEVGEEEVHTPDYKPEQPPSVEIVNEPKELPVETREATRARRAASQACRSCTGCIRPGLSQSRRGASITRLTGSIKLPDVDQVDSEEDEAQEAQTPAEERSPLLEASDLSRSTSTTAFSPPASPSCATSAKPNLFALTDLVDIPHDPIRNVTIKSYTQFNFATAPPFRFLLPPRFHALEKISFALGRKGGPLAPVTPEVLSAPNEASCVEMLVGHGERGEIGDWQVQVGRI